MITRRFRPVVWVVGVAAAATTLYMISLQVASERGRLEEIDHKIASARRDIRQLQTEIGTRANLRQLERWNGEVLALSAPSADQYLSDETALASFDQGVLAGKTDAPAVMFAEAAAMVRVEDQAEPAEPAGAAASPQPRAVPQIAPVATPKPSASQPVLTQRDRQVQQVITAQAAPKAQTVRKVAMANQEPLDRATMRDLVRSASTETRKSGTARP